MTAMFDPAAPRHEPSQNGPPTQSSGAATATAEPRPRPAPPIPNPTLTVCPYCGHNSFNNARCDQCKGLLDPLSRQASQNAMGPWFIRDEAAPFRPGCSYETLRALIAR